MDGHAGRHRRYRLLAELGEDRSIDGEIGELEHGWPHDRPARSHRTRILRHPDDGGQPAEAFDAQTPASLLHLRKMLLDQGRDLVDGKTGPLTVCDRHSYSRLSSAMKLTAALSILVLRTRATRRPSS